MPAGQVRPTNQPVASPASRLEAIIGFNDCDQINFLEHGMRASRSVCRLTAGGQPVGTGFLVGPGLLLTNHHVITNAAAAANFTAEFNYELDADENLLPPQRFRLDPATIFVSSGVEDYDFTLVAVRIPPGAQDFGWLPLNLSGDKILQGEPVIIVQHPDGREKQICLFHSEMVTCSTSTSTTPPTPSPALPARRCSTGNGRWSDFIMGPRRQRRTPKASSRHRMRASVPAPSSRPSPQATGSLPGRASAKPCHC